MSLFFWSTGGVVWCLLFQIQHYLTLSGHTWKQLQGAPCFLQIRKNFNLPTFYMKLHFTQECIPVGCILPSGGSPPGTPEPEPPKDQTPLGPEPPGTRPLPEAGTNPLGPDPIQKQEPPRIRHPPMNRITDTCKNITFPQLCLWAVNMDQLLHTTPNVQVIKI